MTNKTIIITGPCAAESEEQILLSAKEAKKRQVDFLRVSLWKPRTKPGFDGLGEKGIELLVKVAKMGVNPATEVIIPSHAEKVIDTVLTAVPTAKVLLWIGARNQNHYIQQEIARAMGNEKRAYLMVKNQPWPSLEHWEGIIEHVLHGGISKNRLLICHRGFSPNGHANPYGYRNVPDYEMTMKIKNKTKLPVLFDPSHTGGSVDNVFRIVKEAAKHSFDGLIIEVHPNPKNAKTDAKQQLTWKQFDELLKLV
ncbi:MAG: hypothetical protein HYV37_03880 [Candidatus Levyibacteriota bacterium]|nr:MAG: hypothetical protein HYV37_03880 [Candidatus Levybacteria bacterium]